MMALSFETAGLEFEVEPYAIIRPLPPEEQNEQESEDEDTGMEVA